VPELQTRLTPPSRRAPPGQSTGHPPGSSQENSQTPRLRCHLVCANDASTAHAHQVSPRRTLLERLPGPHLTRSSAPSPRTLTTTVFSQRSTRRFDALPRRATPKGQQASIPNTAPPIRRSCLHQPSFSVRDTRLSHKEFLLRGRHKTLARCPMQPPRGGPRRALRRKPPSAPSRRWRPVTTKHDWSAFVRHPRRGAGLRAGAGSGAGRDLLPC